MVRGGQATEGAMRAWLMGMLAAAAMTSLAAPARALESGTDCAEGADEDLGTSQPAPPPAPAEEPTS